MDMVRHGVTFDKFNFLLATQLTDDLAEFSSKLTKQNYLTILRYYHHMIFLFKLHRQSRWFTEDFQLNLTS